VPYDVAMTETTEQFTGRCMRCQETRELTGVRKETKKGQPMLQGPCPVCGTNVSKFVKRSA
jgi:hypothetical protein